MALLVNPATAATAASAATAATWAHCDNALQIRGFAGKRWSIWLATKIWKWNDTYHGEGCYFDIPVQQFMICVNGSSVWLLVDTNQLRFSPVNSFPWAMIVVFMIPKRLFINELLQSVAVLCGMRELLVQQLVWFSDQIGSVGGCCKLMEDSTKTQGTSGLATSKHWEHWELQIHRNPKLYVVPGPKHNSGRESHISWTVGHNLLSPVKFCVWKIHVHSCST